MPVRSIEEAIYLSDRVLVMSAQKGQIVRELSIDLERPRIRTAPCYLDYKNQLTDVLTADLLPSAFARWFMSFRGGFSHAFCWR